MHHLEHIKRNAMCTSKTIQNEIMRYIRKRTEILQTSSAVFSIIADYVTDKHADFSCLLEIRITW